MIDLALTESIARDYFLESNQALGDCLFQGIYKRSNQALGDCLRPYNDLFNFQTLLIPRSTLKLGGKSIITSSFSSPLRKTFLTSN